MSQLDGQIDLKRRFAAKNSWKPCIIRVDGKYERFIDKDKKADVGEEGGRKGSKIDVTRYGGGGGAQQKFVHMKN